jgi:site-specific recombinase XerD
VDIDAAIRAFLNSRRATACSEATVRMYTHELPGLFLRFLQARGLTETGEVTVPVVLDYLAWTHGRGVNANTLNSYRMRVCVFLNWCGTMGWCQPDIARSIPKARTRYYLRKTHTQEEVQQLLTAASNPSLFHPWDAQEMTAMLVLLLDTGMRAGELCGLNVGDVDGELIKLHGKGDNERLVRISELTRECVERYLEMRRQPSPDAPLFINRGFGANYHARGLRMGPHAIYQRIRRLGEKAGIPTHPHRWRHTFAAFAVRNGANLKALQHFLGHSSLNTTDNYLRGFGFEDAARAHKTFSPVGALMQH